MTKTAAKILLCVLVALPLAAQAARKPGLWEVTSSMTFNKGGPQIPPEQLEKMKQMGIEMPFNKPVTMKHCLTKEEAERDDQPPAMRKESNCQTKDFQKSGGSFSAKLVCNGKNMTGEGDIKGTYSGGETYSGTTHFVGTSSHGGQQHDVDMTTEFSGKWLGSDCGDVKPVKH